MIEIALVHPDIPQNTGNVGRLCVGLQALLHIVKPMSFVLDEKRVKRAGLDYWPHLDLQLHDSLDDFLTAMKNRRLFLLSTKGKRFYTDVSYQKGDVLVFGSESKGLPQDFLDNHAENVVKIPMPGKVRSLNLSNAVACVAYEMYRQITL